MKEWAEYAQARYVVERYHEWDKWALVIPFINFPAEWEVKVIPPFGGAIVRFIVKHKQTQKTCSVYLDCYSELGACSTPYWEIYPYENDCYRCYMEKTEDLLKAIAESIG